MYEISSFYFIRERYYTETCRSKAIKNNTLLIWKCTLAAAEKRADMEESKSNVADSPSGLVDNLHTCQCGSREFDSYQGRICVLFFSSQEC